MCPDAQRVTVEGPRLLEFHAAWWANDENGRHVQAAAWMTPGHLLSDVDLVRQQVGVVAGGVRGWFFLVLQGK